MRLLSEAFQAKSEHVNGCMAEVSLLFQNCREHVIMIFMLRQKFHKSIFQNRSFYLSYWQTNLAPHMGRTRYMKCPECGKRSWQKKVLSKEKEVQ